uniref:Ubiquitin-like protease family profile domain-containing protein n=1 Tax=Oryza glumipatula TaxID=40148 RepID=A0A0E0BQI1_9ORYZ
MPHAHKRKMATKAYADSSSDDLMEKVLIKIFRKEAKKAKGLAQSDGSFSRFSATYFSKVVSSLSAHQRTIVENYGFKNLLFFDSDSVPKKFSAWIANKVDLKTSEIILKDRVIRFSEESIRDVLGLPFGGLSFGKDRKAERTKKELSDEQFITSFLIVALACFLCPNSSLCPSVKFCILILLIFGERNVPTGCPRIAVWKEGMISRYSDLDKIDDGIFGLRPLKPRSKHDEALSFRDKLDSVLGDLLPDYLKIQITTMLNNHCCSTHVHNIDSLGDFVISVIKLLADESVGSPIHLDDNEIRNDNASGSADTEVNINADHSDLRDVNAVCDKSASTSAIQEGIVQCSTHASTIAAVAAAVKDVALKFKSRLPQLNGSENVDRTVDLFKPSYKNLFPEVDVCNTVRNRSSDMDNETDGNITPLSGHHTISFHSVEDTPEELVGSKYKDQGTSRTPSSQIIKKRNSPDLIIVGESNFSDRCNKMTAESDQIYNASNLQSSLTHDKSTSGGKIPPHGPRRVLAPGRYSCDPFVQFRSRFPVSDEESRHFIALCRLADSTKWQSFDAVNIDNVKVAFYSFGNSLKKGGPVSASVIAVFCRVMFQNNHPSKSKKNYFFPSIGEQLVVDHCLADVVKVQKSFDGAAKARRLDLCDMLLFPINYLQHWFLFIVDIKDRMFVFLDSEYDEYSEYFENLKTHLKLWSMFIKSVLDFKGFKIVFPPVPRQEYECDSGVFTMKFMEIWSPRILLPNEFSKQDIDKIHVKYANQIFFYEKNKLLQTEIGDVVVNWFNNEKFAHQQGA